MALLRVWSVEGRAMSIVIRGQTTILRGAFLVMMIIIG